LNKNICKNYLVKFTYIQSIKMATTTDLFEDFMLQKDMKEENIYSQLERCKKERSIILSEVGKMKEKCIKSKMSWMKYIDKYNLGTKFGIDISIIDIEIHKLEKQLRLIERRTRPFSQSSLGITFYSKTISPKQQRIIEKEICSICLDTHKIKHIITTKCKHHFGLCCLEKYILNKYDNEKDIHCPLCRNGNILPAIKYC